MSNNPFRDSIDTENLTVLVYCENARLGKLLEKSLNAIGCTQITLFTGIDEAVTAIDTLVPKLVIMVSDVNDPEKLAAAQKLNKKWVRSKGRTPKILGLMGPPW